MQRPTRRENEEDLLRIQEEFLKQHAVPSAKVHRASEDVHAPFRDEKTDQFPAKSPPTSYPSPSLSSHLDPVLSEIKEHTDMDFVAVNQIEFTAGFPAVPRITEVAHQEVKGSSGKKRSLFAQQFMMDEMSAFGFKERASLVDKGAPSHLISMTKNLHIEDSSDVGCNEERMETLSQHSGKLLMMSSRSAERQRGKEEIEIHNENLETLSKMSHEEILDERRKLESTLGSSILEFIKARKNKQNGAQSSNINRKNEYNGYRDNSTVAPMLCQKEEEETSHFNPYTQFDIDRNLPGMDTVEYEKLEWMKDAKKHSWKESETNKTVRFDFKGHVIARDIAIPVNVGLHHHGEDFRAPGYSLDELFNLARSSFLQQKVFALKLLARICEQYQEGSIQGDMQGCLLKQLIDSGLPLLLRESLDDNTSAIHCAAIYAIYAMLWIPTDNDALDELLYLSNGFQVPSLKPLYAEKDTKSSNCESKTKLMDHEVVSVDLIKGLLQIQLLPRLRYILEVCHPDHITVNYCMDILSRIALHSTESALKIVDCPRLMGTVLNIFLPITWPIDTINKQSFPCLKALRLIRLLCIAGKSISSRLWEQHDLCARVLRYTSLVNENNDPSQEEVSLAVEAIHIWRICIIHGVSIVTTVDVHSFLISMLQKYAVIKRGLFVTVMSTAVLLAEAIVRSTLCSSKQKVLDVSQPSQHEDTVHVEKNRIHWTVVSGLHIILMQSLSEEIKNFVSCEEELPNLRGLSALLSYMSAFINSASSQRSVNKVTLLSDISCWTEDLILKILQSRMFSKLLEQISTFSDFITPLHLLSNYQAPRCFPSYGMKIFKEGHRIIDENSVFLFLVSFAKLLHRIVVVNKHCIGKVLPFLRMQALLDYCGCISSFSSSAHKISSMAISSVIERQFLYHLLLLAEKAVSLCPGSIEPALCQTYHTTAFELLTLLQSGESIEAVDLMVGLIFNRKFYESSVDMRDVVDRLDALGIHASSASSLAMENFIRVGIDNMGPMYDIYKKYCLPYPDPCSTMVGSYEQGSLRNAEYGSSLIPLDWIFLPVISLYTITINIELSGQLISQVTTDAIRTIELNLLFLLHIEVSKPEVLKNISSSTKFIRLLCIFLLGSDVFLDPRIRPLLESFFALYTAEKALDRLKFAIPVPGISSCYDLFCELLIQFSACSFGDHVFGNYLLVPLQQRHDVKYRKAIWGEHCDALKCFTMPIKSVMLNLSSFLDDIERDEELMQLYLRGITSDTVTPYRCPFFYLVAVSHLNRFIFDAEQAKGSLDVWISKLSLRLLNRVISMKCEIAKSDIILFEAVDASLTKGFKTYKSLPSHRQWIIENRSTLLP